MVLIINLIINYLVGIDYIKLTLLLFVIVQLACQLKSKPVVWMAWMDLESYRSEKAQRSSFMCVKIKKRQRRSVEGSLA